MISPRLSVQFSHFAAKILSTKRTLWSFVNLAFNEVDKERLRVVGPDRLCAEWILKNGGRVAFTQEPDKYLANYNGLPGEKTSVELKEIDATGTAIMNVGFLHMAGCRHIDRITLHNCNMLDDDSIMKLRLVRHSLKVLEISSCPNLTDKSIQLLGKLELHKLQHLIIYNLPKVKNWELAKQDLIQNLPNCLIQINQK